MDGQPVHRRIRPEAARGAQQVREHLSLFQLVNRGTQHRARDLHPLSVQRHVHDITALEADVGPGGAMEQVVVQVERRRQRVGPADLDLAHVRPRRDATGRVECRHRRAERTDLIRAGLQHFADDGNLVDPDIGNLDGKMRGRRRGTRELRVHATEARVQHVAQLIERQARDEELTDLRDQDEAVATHRQHVGALDVTRENHRELITGADLVVRRNGAAEQRQKLRRRAAKYIDAEHIVACRQRFGGKRLHSLADEPRVYRKGSRAERRDADTECLQRGEHLAARLSRFPRLRAAEVGVKQIRGITVRRESGPYLVWRHARLLDALPQLAR